MACFPINEQRYRIATNLSTTPQHTVSLQALSAMVAQQTQGLFQVKDTTWISPFWIHSKMVAQMQHERVFFAGDAAHIHSPMGGQGMNTGMQDAYNLAWKLALVLQHNSKPALLQSYHAERHPVVATIVKTTERMTRWLLMSNLMIVTLRKLLLKFIAHRRHLIHSITMQITQLAIHYKKSPIIFHMGAMSAKSPLAGEIAPDVQLSQNRRLADVLRGIQHNVLLFTGIQPTDTDIERLTTLVKWLRAHYAKVIKVTVISATPLENCINDENLAAHTRYNVRYAGIYVIRPDNYIAYCDSRLNQDKLQRVLTTMLVL